MSSASFSTDDAQEKARHLLSALSGKALRGFGGWAGGRCMLAQLPPGAAHAGGGSVATAALYALLRAVTSPAGPSPAAAAPVRADLEGEDWDS